MSVGIVKTDKTNKTVKLTAESLKKAVRQARDGKSDELTDLDCRGLQLRVRGGAVTWAVRARLHKRQRRWILGDHLTMPAEARSRANQVKSWCRKGMDPETLVREFATGITAADQIKVAAEAPPPSWNWKFARDEFLKEIKRIRRPATYDDYNNILHNTPELRRFHDRDVAEIKSEEIAEAIAEIHKRVQPHSEHVLRVISSMWTFLGAAVRHRETSVTANLLRGVKAPERTRKERGDPSAAAHLAKDVPTEIELGRVLVIARAKIFSREISDALELMLGSSQRRRPIITAKAKDFLPDAGDLIWHMEPYFRKTASRRRSQLARIMHEA